MYVAMQVAAVALPLLHPTLPAAAAQLHPAPITISGVACMSAHDMVGLYDINAKHIAKTADDLLAVGRDAGFRCQMLRNVTVVNWGAVSAADAVSEAAAGKPLPIVEVVAPGDGPDHRYFLISKTP